MHIKTPLISVIVPVYNVEKYLARCIDSILCQDCKNLEVILVDDGSTDNSINICKEYVQNDSRVSLINQSNQGSSIARNEGLSLAKGEYISFVDSDDWIEPNMLQEMINFALSTNLEVVECASIKSIDYKKGLNKKDNSSSRRVESQEEALERVIENQTFAVWRRIYHKRLIGELRFIPFKIHQDVFFTIDILNKIKQQGYIETPLYIYNVENLSIIRSPYSQKKLDAIDATFYVIQETKDYNVNVRIKAKRHVIQQLMYHYNELFFHNHLDPEYKVRKLIKNEVSKVLSTQSWSIYGILIKYLPFIVYRKFIWLNRYRISAQIYILKLLR